jgi:hypothetical protein
VARPRILLLPTITELEWLVKPLLDDWADVATFDSPGVGSEPRTEGPLFEAVARRGLWEMEQRGWSRCVLVADEFGIGAAIRMTELRSDLFEALALGHACLSLRRTGERAPVNEDVFRAFMQLIRIDYRSFIREDLKIWDPRRAGVDSPPFDLDELANRWIERVPPETAELLVERIEDEIDELGDFEPVLRSLDVPLLFAQHQGCVAFTPEGFEDAVAAFPHAKALTLPTGPNISPRFADALRDFCEEIPR